MIIKIQTLGGNTMDGESEKKVSPPGSVGKVVPDLSGESGQEPRQTWEGREEIRDLLILLQEDRDRQEGVVGRRFGSRPERYGTYSD